MVIIFHFTFGLETDNHFLIILKKICIFGRTGTALFFVLSGFLITRILINTKEDNSYFSKFYIRRSLRIFPLYYLFLLIYDFVLPILQKSNIADFDQQIWFWIYLQNFAATFRWPNAGPGQFWSLAVEEHFYLFWPLVVYFSSVSRIKTTIYVIILAALLVRILLISYGYVTGFFTLSVMDQIAIGALLAVLEIEGKLKSPALFINVFLITILPGAFLLYFPIGLGKDLVKYIQYIPLYFFYFSFIGILITIKDKHWLKVIFRSKPMIFTGKVSYGLYVYHVLCFDLIKVHLKTDSVALSFVIGLSFSYLIASLSYYLFESQFLRLKDKFSYDKTRVIVN